MTQTIPLREAICRSANLASAFERFRRNRGVWVPGVPMHEVTASPVGPVLRLAEDLRCGRYRPNPPHAISIAKADGSQRFLNVYAIRDRVAQRALLQVLQASTDPAMSPYSFGYRPGRSAKDAVAAVRRFIDMGLSWVVDADIERCFDSIPRTFLLTEVTRRLHDESAAEFVACYLGWRSSNERSGVGIPQGSVLAPWLCNVYLWQLDDHMLNRGCPIVRFADDFVIPAVTKRMAESSKEACDGILKIMHLKLHALKTAIVQAASPFYFLGERVEMTLRLPLLNTIAWAGIHHVVANSR